MDRLTVALLLWSVVACLSAAGLKMQRSRQWELLWGTLTSAAILTGLGLMVVIPLRVGYGPIRIETPQPVWRSPSNVPGAPPEGLTYDRQGPRARLSFRVHDWEGQALVLIPWMR